jgi:ABC-type nitrate/sulfonate/bicarbonate transport system substrate-binding protein
MSTGHDRRTFLKGVVGVTAAGLLAACAPSTGAPPASTGQQPAPATTGPAAAKGVTKLTYALASVNGLHFVATVGNEKPDLPHRFGLEWDLVTTTNSPNAINALIGGSVDVAGATPDSAWPAQDKAPDIKQIAAIADGTPYVLLAQPEIKKASELKGKTLGASAIKGGADTNAIRIMLFENGVTDADYTIVQAGAISDRTAAMKAKSIQAVAQIEPQATILRDEGFPEIDSANNYPALKSVHSVVMLTKQGWYESNADTAANLIRAFDSITKWIYDPANKAEVLAITKKTMGANDKSAEAVYNLHVSAKSVPQDLRIREKYMQQFVENQRKTGAENLPNDPMKYVDNSLVERALKA